MDVSAETSLGFRPLYLQVREEITRQLASGRWQPGTMLPSEQELARELGVSQGTVRKALDAMTAERILVRRQGRGTFVAEYEESRILFQFFRLYPDSGERLFPISKVLNLSSATPNPREREALGLDDKATVWRISRLRYHGSELMLRETLSLPGQIFQGLSETEEIPNNVYRLYSQRWGITVTRIAEKLKAVSADEADRAALNCAVGAPLLEIRRIAFDLHKRPVEYRESRCQTDTMHYASDLS
ncbi:MULTISPECIES: GntR family transcriptional regulator [unclassified Sinorhizobium]|uniref:GntR family transcriptional regulator n=1 Tax=unclassified Sinorhizobium TaxID=2613772 RepID=UPI0024C2E16C|nr:MULTISPECIES: GntR family transcriptional regulator [unclassified Sinorhizobium]MDK1377292.1 GntR family transcriptional regulator [Sinorhizobium sp. 6-70]MDK1481903.1 GntR family transcriptional regulator [Sinorhizobium sp. 6-117]